MFFLLCALQVLIYKMVITKCMVHMDGIEIEIIIIKCIVNSYWNSELLYFTLIFLLFLLVWEKRQVFHFFPVVCWWSLQFYAKYCCIQHYFISVTTDILCVQHFKKDIGYCSFPDFAWKSSHCLQFFRHDASNIWCSFIQQSKYNFC